ncbi:hypothetical protein LWI28_002715 [Acer negundo]|uniref:BD-FAE-like domain-containing protein n=1 Tax=Acer negundo TaxID=4023 RepID=A0AAD5NER5_ACENE|nr:hypothetical protein LWI28_002715 [Acer negundo]
MPLLALHYRLDLYLPTHIDEPKPVVVFVTGGAWIIGYKAWGSLLGRQLAERDIVVACVDYRNFPQGTVSDMVKDVSQGISFICDYIADYGGDPKRLTGGEIGHNFFEIDEGQVHIDVTEISSIATVIKEIMIQAAMVTEVLMGNCTVFSERNPKDVKSKRVDSVEIHGKDEDGLVGSESNGISRSLKSSKVSHLACYDTEIKATGSMFGNYFRVTTFGESHGGGVGCIIDGCPPRIPLSEADMQFDLDRRLSTPLIGEDGKIYSCSEKTLFAFESNGYIAWSLDLDFKCNVGMPPVHGGRGTMYLVAEQTVLKVNFLKMGTSESATQVFFGPGPGQQKPDEIIGVAVSTLSSLVFINVKNRGLFAFAMHGQLLWSVGPVLDQFGYRQGCRRTVTDCYFTSVPVIDQYASSGNVLWQGSTGPLSAAEYAPVVDSNGWISVGSLDGFLYSFSPTGTLKKFSNSATFDSVIQVSPLLACSGNAIYLSQTEMSGKIIHTNGGFTYVSATKPRTAVFSLLVPATGSIYWSESYPAQFSSLLSQSDLQHFVLDESLLIAFVTAASQKLASSCSQARPKPPGNQRAILLFLFFESLVLLVLMALVPFCCKFWRKKKLQGQNLGNFLEKRRWLQLKKKTVDRRIAELEQKKGAEEVVGNLVEERQGIERKLSRTYSLGRDGGAGLQSKSLLPLYDFKTTSRSYSLRDAKNESVKIFQTLSDTSSSRKSSSSDSEEEVKDSKSKAPLEAESSSDEDGIVEKSTSEPSSSLRVYTNPLFVEKEKQEDHEALSTHHLRRMFLKRRTLYLTQ